LYHFNIKSETESSKICQICNIEGKLDIESTLTPVADQ